MSPAEGGGVMLVSSVCDEVIFLSHKITEKGKKMGHEAEGCRRSSLNSAAPLDFGGTLVNQRLNVWISYVGVGVGPSFESVHPPPCSPKKERTANLAPSCCRLSSQIIPNQFQLRADDSYPCVCVFDGGKLYLR